MLAVQICPNARPPFADVLRGHARALELCGYRVRTIVLASRALVPRGEQPDLVVSHRYRAYRTGLGLDARRHIAVAHEFGFFARARRRWRRRLLGDGGCRFAGVSSAVADELRDAGVPEPLVLPNPIDARALRRGLRSRNAARGILGLGVDDFAIGVVGRLHPKKDPLRALRAFGKFGEAEAGVRLVFLGDGELRPALEREAGAHGGVVFAGFRPDAKALLKAFDVILACATEHEAFGLALLEALAAGVPVVCADRPGPRFVLGDCATYFETDEALVAALRDVRGGRLIDAESGMRRAERLFSVAALAERYRAARA